VIMLERLVPNSGSPLHAAEGQTIEGVHLGLRVAVAVPNRRMLARAYSIERVLQGIARAISSSVSTPLMISAE
jgi:hypothetical protein